MILYTNIVKISKNRWIGYMLKVAFLLASSIHVIKLITSMSYVLAKAIGVGNHFGAPDKPKH